MSAPSAPSAPSASQSATASYQAAEQNYPILLQEATAANNGGSFTDPNTGQTYNFAGSGLQSQAQTQLNLQQQYGTQFAQQAAAELQAENPNLYNLQQSAITNASQQLAAGSSLTPDQERQVQQQYMQAQSNAGNVMGPNPAIDEAINTFGVGQNLLQQREANAASILGGSQNTASQSTTLGSSGLGNTAGISLPQALPSATSLQQQGLQYGAQTYQSSINAYQAQNNENNPWMQYAGIGLGLAGAAGGAYTGYSGGSTSGFGGFGSLLSAI